MTSSVQADRRLILNGLLSCLLWLVLLTVNPGEIHAGSLLAGAARRDITDYDAGPVNDPLYVKVIALKSDNTWAVLISVDAVAIGEIGRIKNDFLPKLRGRLSSELSIPGSNVVVNASHCHGVVLPDITALTFDAVQEAISSMVPVYVGSGRSEEHRISENRRLKRKNGKEIDVRHAYPLPADNEISDVAPIDPEIGILKLQREDGSTLGVIYNFACHPIQGVPSKGNTADIIGFSSKAIEENLSRGATALFLQGCGGDINPTFYKDVNHPRSAEPLGNQLGLSTLRGIRQINCGTDNRLSVINETLTLPRGDRTDRIAQLEAEQNRLLRQFQGTSLNFETFLPLAVKYQVAKDYPSYYSHRYLYDDQQGRSDLKNLDAENRKNIEAYLRNIAIMEELTRVQTNLALLHKHQASLVAAGSRTIDVEVLGLRIGDFVMITFPGELTSPIGMNIKKKSPHEKTFVAGYTNGYIYYAPTAEQLENVGGAQEDSDCILAPEWQEIFETRAAELLKRL